MKEIALKPCKKEFYTYITESSETTIIHLEQNLEAPNGDHWRIELYLNRWRTKKELAYFLRRAAEIVDTAPLTDAPKD